MKRILQILATSIALLLMFALAVPALAASTCPTANTSPISNCLAKYKLTASDISNIQEKLRQCGLTEEVLRYGPICESGGCTTPDCTKVDCDGTQCVTTDCAQTVCSNTSSTPAEEALSCTEADCANNGCDAADCATAGCKDSCATTKCIPAVEEKQAEEGTEAEAVAPTQAQDDTEVKAAATEETGSAAIDEAIAQAKEAVKNYGSSSNCPTSSGSNQVAGVVIAPQQSSNCPTSGNSDVKSQLQDAVNKALDQAKSKVSSGSNCPTSGSNNSAQLQDAVNKALDQVKSYSGSNCPKSSGSVDVNGILNQLQNSGLYNCNK